MKALITFSFYLLWFVFGLTAWYFLIVFASAPAEFFGLEGRLAMRVTEWVLVAIIVIIGWRYFS